jgi:hypothetical protein
LTRLSARREGDGGVLEPKAEHAIAQVEDVGGLELKLTPTLNQFSEGHGHCLVTAKRATQAKRLFAGSNSNSTSGPYRTSMSSKSRRLKAAQPEIFARRKSARLSRERGSDRRRWASAVKRRYRPGKCTIKRSSRVRERVGGPLHFTRVTTTFCIRHTLSPLAFPCWRLARFCSSVETPNGEELVASLGAALNLALKDMSDLLAVAGHPQRG